MRTCSSIRCLTWQIQILVPTNEPADQPIAVPLCLVARSTIACAHGSAGSASRRSRSALYMICVFGHRQRLLIVLVEKIGEIWMSAKG